jgi:hypothetical protein
VAIHKANVSIDISGWGPKYIPAPLKHDMQRRLQDKVLFGSDYPGWSAGPVLRRMGDGRLPARHDRQIVSPECDIGILKLEDAVARAAKAKDALNKGTDA